MLLSFGHANVKVLDGGLKKWLREGRPTHSGKVTPKPGKFQARLDPGYLRSQQQLVENLKTHAEQLIDARPRPRFEGSVAEPRPGLRGGHIPGSRNVPYAELFDAGTGAMKPLEELRKAFTGAGIDLARPIVTTCGSGVSALVLTLALYRLGVRGSALYDGSWAEWGHPTARQSWRGTCVIRTSTAARRDRLLRERTGRLLRRGLLRQPGAMGEPAALFGAPRLVGLLDAAAISLGAGSLQFRLNRDGRAAQCGDFRRARVGTGRSRGDHWFGCGHGRNIGG